MFLNVKYKQWAFYMHTHKIKSNEPRKLLSQKTNLGFSCYWTSLDVSIMNGHIHFVCLYVTATAMTWNSIQLRKYNKKT